MKRAEERLRDWGNYLAQYARYDGDPLDGFSDAVSQALQEAKYAERARVLRKIQELAEELIENGEQLRSKFSDADMRLLQEGRCRQLTGLLVREAMAVLHMEDNL